VRAASSAVTGGVPVDQLVLRSPVTTPCRVVAQAVNYRGHAQESGFGESPPAVIEKMGDLLPTPLKWRVFFSRQERKPAYLKAGDQVTASIATGDGALDLGTQRVAIRDGP
jgi:hypothetical protein